MNKADTLLDGMNSVALFFQDLDTPYRMGKREVRSLLHILSHVKDFRCPSKTVYRLENLLAICFYLAMKGEFQSFYYAADYVEVKEEQFVALGLIEEGKIPSHDTFRRVFGHLDANGLRDAFLDRIKEFLERLVRLDARAKGKKVILSGDGKTFNGSGRGDEANLNVFNIYNASSEICLSSVPLTDKQSEILEFQRMLPKYDLKNTVVTADAMHCQRKTSEIILKRKGDYVFKVKANQPELLRDVSGAFDRDIGKHSKLNHNQCDYEFLSLRATYVGCDWPGQKTYVKMVSYKRKGQKDFNTEPQYFITSETDLQLIAEAIDNRWQIENGLHKFKDEVLLEDECTFMDQNAVKVMATINNTVYSIYRLASAIRGDKSMSRTRIRFKDDPLSLIATVLPLLEKKNLSALIRENMRGKPKKTESA